MSTIINASTSSGLIQTADTSGTLELQSNGTTQLQVDSTGVALKAGGSTQFTVESTGAYGQLKSGTAVTASGTSVDIPSIPSWVKRITVMFDGVSTNGTSSYLIQLGDSGGIENTGYVASGKYFASGSLTGATSSAGFIIGDTTVAANLYSGHFTLTKVSGNTWTIFGAVATAAGAVNMSVGGKTLSDTLTQIRITTVIGSQTFDAGSINILYEG